MSELTVPQHDAPIDQASQGGASGEVPGLGPVVQHWIDGAATSGASTRTADVFDPATGQVAR
ncbi:hypothetical protein, partial [Quadrisphaera sp. KR29]|uniref:hypothetical protein n=1 Tax=Quadrisphaera sp. KR29 TaxID=3461391 RepID=UPI004044DAEF